MTPGPGRGAQPVAAPGAHRHISRASTARIRQPGSVRSRSKAYLPPETKAACRPVPAGFGFRAHRIQIVRPHPCLVTGVAAKILEIEPPVDDQVLADGEARRVRASHCAISGAVPSIPPAPR